MGEPDSLHRRVTANGLTRPTSNVHLYSSYQKFHSIIFMTPCPDRFTGLKVTRQTHPRPAILYLSAQVLSGIFRPSIRPMGESVNQSLCKDPVIVFSNAATPPKAQHPQPLRLMNYWRRQIWRALDHPTTEGAHNASCNLSGTKDRWGAARFRAAPFLFAERK
jgi:hypothetical protein